MHRTQAQTRSAQRRTVMVTTLFVVFVCVSLLAIDVWLAWKTREQQLKQGVVSNANLASAVAQQMDGMISEVEHLINSVAFELELGRSDDRLLDHLKSLLRNQAATNRHIHGIFIYDALGGWVVNSLGETPIGINNADRDYFVEHRKDPSLMVRVGKPIVSRSTGVWVIPVSRRLNDAAGRFAGVVLATIKVDHVSRILSHFEIGQQGAIALTLGDGTILVRRPFVIESLGKALTGTQLQKDFMSKSAGSYESISPFDGVERLGSFQHTQNHSLLVAVALSKHEMLKDWRETTWVQTLWILLLCAVTAVAGGQVVRLVRQRMKIELDLRETRDELTKANSRLAQLASYDGLTGLANRRFFEETLERSFSEACRSDQPMSVVMIDVDHFKSYNDFYGHPEGDKCLQKVAQAIESAARRPLDFVARYGGEEIVMVLPNTDIAGALVVAEIARKSVKELCIMHSAQQLSYVSISLGVATYGLDSLMESSEALVKAADQALYIAKSTGRDRVICHQ